MQLFSFRYRLTGIIGNILEHYDNALFGLLAPFIAPLFFVNQDPITALILTYAILPVGILTRPLGSLFFGWVGDRLGTRQALFYSLTGMAIATVSLGFLPTYHAIGVWAPILLTIGRMLQNFCAAGEATGAAIFLLESTELKKRSVMSSIVDVSSMIGILVASALVTLLSSQGHIEQTWRYLFWAGGITAILGMILRAQKKNIPIPSTQTKNHKTGLIYALKEHKNAFFAIILASGFSYTTYSTVFTLMNGFVPLVTHLSKTSVMQVNTVLLLIDMLLLPCFGYLARRIGKEKLMISAAFCMAACAIPLFMLLEHADLALVIIVRLFIVTIGVAFAATYHAWAIERVPPEHRYTILALGCAIGSQLIGVPTSAICLWLYQVTGWIWAPGVYLTLVASLASYAVYSSVKAPKAMDFAQA